MVTYERPIFGKTSTSDSTETFKDSQVWSATVASTGETLLGKIDVPAREIWILESIWCQGSGGEYRLDIGSFTDATCDYNNDPTVTCDANTNIKVGMSVTGSASDATDIPDDNFITAVTEGGGAGTGVTTFELNAATINGNHTNETLTFTHGAHEPTSFNGKFIQNSDGDTLKNSNMYSLDVLVKGENVLCVYITNNDATSIVCKAIIQYIRYDISETGVGSYS